MIDDSTRVVPAQASRIAAYCAWWRGSSRRSSSPEFVCGVGGNVMLRDDGGDRRGVARLPPEQSTAQRNAQAKRARQDGDGQLAEAIRGLAKPNLAAWLVNQMVREYPSEMAELLDLGAALREATASLDAEQLKDLSGQQRRVVHALVQQGRSLGRAAGHPVSEDTARGVEEALHAALADPGAAEEVRGGRLTATLSSGGFPSTAARAKPATPVGTKRAAPRSADEERLAAADRDLAEARVAVEEATAQRERAEQALHEAQSTAEQTASRVAELRDRLEEAVADRPRPTRRSVPCGPRRDGFRSRPARRSGASTTPSSAADGSPGDLRRFDASGHGYAHG
ncbi:hypothetical protein AB0K00_40470 [Dactylosporangium sp. NPDC049525]|uniref:hypothetical protein n=1 Tax=Dactylosporangium sp. NPDC049525 TaxID=3154730 RepID=UPI003418FC0B